MDDSSNTLNLKNNILAFYELLKRSEYKYENQEGDEKVIKELKLTDLSYSELNLEEDIISSKPLYNIKRDTPYSPINHLLEPFNIFKTIFRGFSAVGQTYAQLLNTRKMILLELEAKEYEAKEYLDPIIKSMLEDLIIKIDSQIVNNLRDIKSRLNKLKEILIELNKIDGFIFSINPSLDENTNIGKKISSIDYIFKKIEELITEIDKILSKISSGAGGKKSKKLPKKEILGKMRSIYKIPGDRKEYLKHKGKLITFKEYKELMKAKLKKKEVKPKKVKKTKSKK